MKAAVIGIIVVVLVVAAGAFFYLNQTPSPPEDSQAIDSNLAIGPGENVNKKAAFAIFTNGTFRVFTASMYHNLSEDVFIESPNPNIVQVKKEGVSWDDFFKTLPFKLDPDCLTTGTGQTFCSGQEGRLKFYLNGSEDKDALDKIINNGDKLLISFGNTNEGQIVDQIEKVPNP